MNKKETRPLPKLLPEEEGEASSPFFYTFLRLFFLLIH